MEERSRILQSIRSKKSVVETDLQMHMDDVTRERKLSKINEEDTVSIEYCTVVIPLSMIPYLSGLDSSLFTTHTTLSHSSHLHTACLQKIIAESHLKDSDSGDEVSMNE